MSKAYLAAKNNLIRCWENTFCSLFSYNGGNNRYPWPVAGKSPGPNKHISHPLVLVPSDPQKESET